MPLHIYMERQISYMLEIFAIHIAETISREVVIDPSETKR